MKQPELDELQVARIVKVIESTANVLTKTSSEHVPAFHLCAVIVDKPIGVLALSYLVDG